MNFGMRALRKNQDGTFALQITSMIDMFTIILVFLLKSYSSSAVNVETSQTMRLPSSTSTEQAVEALKLMVSENGIFVDDKLVVSVSKGGIDKASLDPKDAKFIPLLYQSLLEQAQKTKNISKQNETVAFDGKVIFQGDQGLSYQVLRKVMYTASLAGYTDFKFAVASSQ
jgi:biopolymer transport protein ExbD